MPNMRSSTRSRQRSYRRAVQIAAGIAVSAAFAWLAVRGVRLGDVTHALVRAHWRWLVPATALLLVAMVMRSIRWALLFPAARRPGAGACFWALNVGYLANALLPFRAGEVIRVMVLSRETGTSRTQGLVTIVLERVFDLFSIAVLMLAVAPLVPPGATRTSLVALSLVTLVATLVAVAVLRSARLRRRVALMAGRLPLSERRLAMLRSGAEALEPLRQPRAAGLVLAWSFGSWLVLAASTIMVERAFVRGLPWPSGALALVATTYAQAIPSSAASVGVFEAAARQSIATYGVAAGTGLAFAIALHAVSVLPTLPLGIAGLGRMGVRSLLPARPPRPAIAAGEPSLEVSIIIPCLDEQQTIGGCVRSAWEALSIADVTGEVIVVDNGSRDSSAAIAGAAGARVIHEPRHGYGSAYLAGLAAARGRYMLMGDGDGTYDFTALPAFLALARAGAELVMGSRFRGTILPGAMPWHHRWIGNPMLTGLLNLLFRSGVSDAHCGLRMISRTALPRLNLRTPGMEFASEMVISAKRAGLAIAETEIVYGARPRDSASKLRSLRDGLRHVRYILAWASGTALAVPVAGFAVLGVVLVLLPGASITDMAAGAGLLTVAALALQAVICLIIWRAITIEGVAAGWLRRAIDRRVLVATSTAIVIAGLAVTALAHVDSGRVHHAIRSRQPPAQTRASTPL
jgi:uncharacterized protein (TIRG00374 family)